MNVYMDYATLFSPLDLKPYMDTNRHQKLHGCSPDSFRFISIYLYVCMYVCVCVSVSFFVCTQTLEAQGMKATISKVQ